MADRTRLVTVGAGGQLTTLRDYETNGSWEKARGSFKWTAPQGKGVDSSRDRRFAGSRVIAESHDNGSVAWTALVSGATSDLALANAASVMSDLRYAGSVPRFVEYRPEGASYSTLFEVRGPATIQLNYNWAQFVGSGSMLVDITIPVAPLTRGLPMDVNDTFATDTTADYTADASAITDVTVSGGALIPVVGAALTAERRLRHTGRGYTMLEAQGTAHGAPGATITSFKLGRTLCASSSSTYIEVYVDDNGVNSRLRVDVVIAGVRTNRASTNLVARVSSGTEFWVRGRTEGNAVYSEYFTSQPTPMGTPTLTGTAYTLTSAERASLVAGSCGLTWIPQHASAAIYDIQIEPFTYFNRTPPEDLPLRSVIPGDAPALADITITHSGGAQVPIFALIGWAERPAVWNMVWNGDLEETGTDGWTSTNATWLTAGATLSRDTATKKYGAASLKVVTAATASQGAVFTIYRRFRKGVTYTATAWISGTAVSSTLRFGDYLQTGSDFTTTAFTPSGALTLITATWTPTADRDAAVFVFRTEAATIGTFNIDAVTVYEGTTAPTVGRHSEGAGAAPPFGTIEAESCDTGDLTGWAITNDVLQRGSFKLYDSVVSGVESYTAAWYIDPNLMVADDFTLGEIDVEVWAFMILHASLVAPRVVLSARPEAGLSFGTERFTAEWGTAGRLLTQPSSATANRFCRLGTITLPVDLANPARWKLWMAVSTLGGSSGVIGCDYLVLTPSRFRAASPSAKVNDTTYPPFVRSTSETSKTILSDLRGLIAKPPLPATGDKGLGGTPLELPAGSTDLVLKLGSTVPDDPTSGTQTEQPWHNATIHAAITPRFNGFRSS